MELKLHAGNVKVLDAKGEGQAIFAQMDIVDLDGDVTNKGAFGEQTAPMVAAHDWEEAPIGKCRIHEENNYALADFQMNLKTACGSNWYEALRFDMDHPPPKQQYSYGYNVKEYSFGEMNGQRVRFLKALEVLEVSPVLLGAGIGTRTVNLKQGGDGNSIAFLLKQAIVSKAKLAGKTQFQLTAELAEKSGMEQTAVYQILAGDVEPSKGSFLQAVSEVLGINLDQLQSNGGTNGKPKQHQDRETVPLHTTATDNRTWESTVNERRVKSAESAAYYKRVFAWQDPEVDPASKTAWRFAHHLVDADGNPGAASIKACSMGIAVLNGARGGTIIPESDRRGVWDHLAKHLEDAEITAPVLRSVTDATSKLADQIRFLIWDTEACIERVQGVRDMRAKEGRTLPEDRVEQIEELKTSLAELDALIRRPIMDGQSVDVLHKFNELRTRRLDLDRS